MLRIALLSAILAGPAWAQDFVLPSGIRFAPCQAAIGLVDAVMAGGELSAVEEGFGFAVASFLAGAATAIYGTNPDGHIIAYLRLSEICAAEPNLRFGEGILRLAGGD